MKRQLATLAATVGLASGAFAATIDLSTVTSDTIFNNGDVLTGTLGANVKLSIADKALVTLRNVTIDGVNNSSYNWAGLTCLGNAEIRIDGINYVRGFHQHHPGIYVPDGKTLTIRQAVNNPSYLNALGGGTLEARDNGYAAGIGAGANSSCGNIVIESGIISAQGHNSAGIGGSGDASCGDITIKGGVVCATGGFDGAGIGGCGTAGCGAITIEDGVTLVAATAGSKCENPIGAGAGGTCGAITVTLADGATNTVDGNSPPTRTIAGLVGAEQYANGVAWKFRIVDGEAEICDEYYTSDGEAHYRPAIDSSTTGALVIPDTLGGCPVTRIGSYACGSCKQITSVTIPTSVNSIGDHAFQYCEALTDVTMPLSGVTDIGERAFESCGSLTSVTIPATVTSIGERAFAGCDSLTSVTIPGNVKRIGDSAFEDCAVLTSVTIEDGVETIGESAFGYCGSLTSVTIPASVKTVEARTFENCTSLATLNLSNGTAVEEGALLNCVALADANGFIIINGVLHQYVGGEADVTVPAGVTRIGAMAFAAHTSKPIFPNVFPPLVSVTLPDSVTSIGTGAFAYCLDLEKVTFPANMPSVEDGAFSLCVKLADADGFVVIGGALHLYIGTASEVTIPAGVTSIGPESFITYTGNPPHYFWTSPVKSLTIPSGVTKIGPHAFDGCPELTTVCIPSTMTAIGEAAFMMGTAVPLQTVHVEAGDTERVKGLLVASGHPVDGITFVEDYLLPDPDPVDPDPVDPDPVDPDPVDPDPVDPDPVDPDPVEPEPGACFATLSEGDITAPYAAAKVMKLKGAAYDGCDVVGVIELKLGKVSKRKTSKVSGSFIGLDGKKRTMKAVTVTGIDGTAAATVALDVKGLGRMTAVIGGSQFAGALGSWHVQSVNVGGIWMKAHATAAVTVGDVSAFGSGVLADLLPTNEVATVARGKWSFMKAANVKWNKPKAGQAAFTPLDASGKGLIIDTSKNRTNLSGLKLNYTPKKGTFKGSFKVYAVQNGKIKKFTVKVNGVVVDGVGYGSATSRSPVLSWPVTVK